MTARLRRILLVVGIALAASAGDLLLDPSPTWATACQSTTLDVYTAAGFTCSIDDKEFSHFVYNPGGPPGGGTVAGPAASRIQVTPDITPFNPGLTFQGNWQTTGAGQTIDSKISYSVAVIAGGHLINDAALRMSGASTGPLDEVIIVETLCLGGAPCVNPVILSVSNISGSGRDSDTVTFDPVQRIDATKEITLGENATDKLSAKVDSVSNNFSEVPEPATLALVGTGLFGVGWFRRRGASKA